MDLNWTEILTLLVLGIIMFGPEKLPDLARRAARIINYLGKIGSEARGQLRAELGPEFDDLRLSDLNPKNFVARHILSSEEKEDLLAIRDEFRDAGQLALDPAAEASGTEAEPEAEPVAVAVSRTPFDPEAT